ncbi:MAG: hypothetical protein HY296_05255 [Thaumarchaeota archaeon]|nr:hypothetical protein [Nitrososphaerota archaeon]
MKSAGWQGGGVAESSVHRSMKDVVRRELERESYRVVEEPLYPPGRWLWWDSYRPDLLGYRREGQTEEIVLVECETHPNMKRFSRKNYRSVWFQPGLFLMGSVRRILAVPRGGLRGVDMKLRNGWEIWVVGRDAPMEKAPAMDTT